MISQKVLCHKSFQVQPIPRQSILILVCMLQVNENLFTVLEKGDRKIKLAKKKVIALCGLTRQGKSSSFNWITGKDMIGEGDEIESHYINVVKNDAGVAELGNEYTSVTLVPNIININEDTTLIDLAGYFDSRNYVGVMGVSYFLQSVFQHAEEVKFIIVLSEHSFFDVTGAGITKTLLGFLNMFDEAAFANPSIKAKIFDSISLLVTRTQDPAKHGMFLTRISKKLKEPNFKVEKKDLMNNLVDYLISANRKACFPAAVDKKNPPKCEILDELNGFGWKYFDLMEAERGLGRSVIHIPFAEEFENSLKKPEQQEFENVVKSKILKTVEFNEILKEYIAGFLDKWKQYGCQKPLTLENLKKVLDFKPIFQKVKSFLKENDDYGTQERIKPITGTYTTPTLVQSLKNVMKIYELGEKSDEIQIFGDFKEVMTMFCDFFISLVNCLTPLCSNLQEDTMLQRLKFIMERSFYEFIQFNKIDESKFSYSKNTIKDRCNTCIGSESKKHEYLEAFISKIGIPEMTTLFKTLKEVSEYEELFNFYKDIYEFSHEVDEETTQRFSFTEKEIDICFVKADLLMKNGQKVKAAEQFVQLMRSLVNQGGLIDSLPVSKEEIEMKQSKLVMSKNRISKKIITILSEIDIRTYIYARPLAISLSSHIADPHETVKVYKLMIRDEVYPQKKAEILQNYADFCIEWGRFEEAKVVLQYKLSISDFDYEVYRQTEENLIRLVEDIAVKESDLRSKLNRLYRLPIYDDTLTNLLNEIGQELSKKPVDISKQSNPESNEETSPTKSRYQSRDENSVLGELYT